jgi:hypothetical protein
MKTKTPKTETPTTTTTTTLVTIPKATKAELIEAMVARAEHAVWLESMWKARRHLQLTVLAWAARAIQEDYARHVATQQGAEDEEDKQFNLPVIRTYCYGQTRGTEVDVCLQTSHCKDPAVVDAALAMEKINRNTPVFNEIRVRKMIKAQLTKPKADPAARVNDLMCNPDNVAAFDVLLTRMGLIPKSLPAPRVERDMVPAEGMGLTPNCEGN